MMKFIKKTLFAAGFILLIASPVMAVTAPAVSTTAAAAPCGQDGILGIPAWFRGVVDETTCAVLSPDKLPGVDPKKALSVFIWKIVLNIINMALVIAVYVAIFFILYGGFLFITGGDKPGQVEKARKSILDAIIGLVISMAAIAIVNLVFGIIK